jgi:hypothetical protein
MKPAEEAVQIDDNYGTMLRATLQKSSMNQKLFEMPWQQ